MTYFKVKVEDKVALITLNRPPANALSKGVLKELDQVLKNVKSNDDVHVLLLHGEGRFFAAGADIKEFTEAKDGAEFAQHARMGQELFEEIENFPKPVIVAIHGAALGGGLELAMACHIRLATKDAKLGLPELSLGLIPGFAGSQRLARFVGTAKATEMLLTSEPITAMEAQALGLVNSTYESEESLLAESRKLALKIAAKSRVAVERTLELLTYSQPSKQQAGSIREAELFGEVFDSEDGKEGIQAFIEKRSPNFKHK
ncbi:enoyl-CoA hydratase [Halalkalibacter akibai]|uniref:Enoyl-CoA hydratase n=1 Tax=Halalkalibacter akibai (strain ATCC 43226 / DSM 21942 / CIP 109018 / JCM 9157 / 1139) TaxID=1236973 RepID=W4QS07_HALA3|nr:enoyl-CoA hydratase [Halalkalibacter akibai]GAE34885.1 enoyl-CoA hydratase [Halalkalibacter akibai JCM 9157]